MADERETTAQGAPAGILALFAGLAGSGLGASLTFSVFPSSDTAPAVEPERDAPARPAAAAPFRAVDLAGREDAEGVVTSRPARNQDEDGGPNAAFAGLQDGLPLPKFVLDSPVLSRATSGNTFTHRGVVIAFTRYADRESAYLVRFHAQPGLDAPVERWRDESELEAG